MMNIKNIFILLIVFSLTACSDQEVATRQGTQNSALVGTWALVEQKVSIGGPATWEPTSGGDLIRFGADGTFAMPHLDCKPVSYQRSGDLIQLTYDCPEDSEYADWPSHVNRLDYRIVELTDQHLTITPATFMCMETCLYKYARQEDHQ